MKYDFNNVEFSNKNCVPFVRLLSNKSTRKDWIEVYCRHWQEVAHTSLVFVDHFVAFK